MEKPNTQLEQLLEMITNMGLAAQIDEENPTFIRTGISANGRDFLPIIVSIEADIWVYVSTYLLVENALNDDAALASFYKALLRENNYTKVGKYYLNQQNYLEFSVDFTLETLSQTQLEEAFTCVTFAIFERFPAIMRPYQHLLFQLDQKDELH